MSNIAYVPPRVTISEAVAPTFNPALIDPNTVCIVGPAQGYQTHTELALLADNHEYTLSATYPDLSTLSIVDASNVTNAPFVASTPLAKHDYDVDTTLVGTTGQVAVKRAMQTTIADAQTVVVYYENSASPAQADAHTELLTLSGTSSAVPVAVNSGTQAGSIMVASEGLAPANDYTINNSGQANVNIVWRNTATVLKKFQTVYLDYSVSTTVYKDVAVQLNNLSTVALTANAASIVVKTAPGVADNAATSVVYTKGSTIDLDYIVSGSGATTAIARSAGTTTMGLAQDKLVVRITYNATPADYWQPTRCFSMTDVQSKFGSAYDSNGNIINPVSFAASLAFANGVNSVIIQALFAAGTPNTQPTGSVADWQNTLVNLRTLDGVDVIVPVISAGGLTTSDAQNLQILEAVQDHLNFMAQQQQQLIVAVCGEDSTGGSLASKAVLQNHAQSLAARTPDSISLISPASFTYLNPITGLPNSVGGQYVAACVAGMWGQYAVQMPLTRKRINAITGVLDQRTEADKNADGAAGLLVVESKQGIVRVRHAITVSSASVASQELNVVRAKFWMMTSLASSLDSQVIGNYVIDNNTAFQIQLAVDSVLQLLLQQGALVAYHNIQVRRSPNNPTGMQIQFSYLPAYALNYLDISFSLDAATGVNFSSGSAAIPTQGQGL